MDHPFTTSITYCVDVIQILGSTETSQLVSSECGLTETVYSFTSPGHGPCDRFNFTVIATDGVHNGTSSVTVTGYFTQATGGLVCLQLNKVIPNYFNMRRTIIILSLHVHMFWSLQSGHMYNIFNVLVLGFNNALIGEMKNTIISADPWNPPTKEVTVETMVWIS